MKNKPSEVGFSQESRQILFCRFPGLLAYAIRLQRQAAAEAPLVIAEGRTVRDVCPIAQDRGVRVGASTIQARRLCPTALIVPLDEVHCLSLTTRFLDHLADVTPTIEPIGLDAAFADLTGVSLDPILGMLAAWGMETFGIRPVHGVGISRLAARACAQCGLLPSCLADADVTHLWPEDPKVAARLQRLGLPTFGSVSRMPESVLVHHFGKSGRLISRRAKGIDLTPIRALYPPPRADVRMDLSEYPVEETQRLDAALSRLSGQAAQQLLQMGRHGRRIVVRLTTERDEVRRERELSIPVQSAQDLSRLARYLTSCIPVTAPITAIRLLVEEAERPAAQTLALFPDKIKDRETVLQQTRRTLHTKYGVKALQRLSELPIPLRDERRTLMREAFGIG